MSRWTRYNVEVLAPEGWRIAGNDGLDCMTPEHADSVMALLMVANPGKQFRVTPHHNKPATRPNYR